MMTSHSFGLILVATFAAGSLVACIDDPHTLGSQASDGAGDSSVTGGQNSISDPPLADGDSGGGSDSSPSGGGSMNGGGGGLQQDEQAGADGSGGQCGDPEIMDRYDDCVATTDEESCRQLGGEWGTLGLSTEESCQCPTGDEGCSCSSSTDCVESCEAPLTEENDCSGVIEGTCAPRSGGCACSFNSEGEPLPLCTD